MRLFAAAAVLAIAGCGSVDDESTAPARPTIPPKPVYVCTDVVDGHKVTYYCDEIGRRVSAVVRVGAT